MSKNTQSKIVAKAEKLLWFRGYEGTSLNDLVAKAGVSKGAFFHYYDSKQAISQDVIDKYANEQLKAHLERHLTGTASVRHALMGWITGIYEAYKLYGFKGGCLLGNMALELSDQNEAARERIRGHFLDLENMLTSHLRPLAGENRLAMEPRQAARLILASLEGTILMVKVHKDNNRAARDFQALGQLVEMLVRDA